MKWIFLSLAAAAAVVFLIREKSTAAVLQAELAQHRVERAQLETLRREHARLLALRPKADELAQLQRALSEQAERRRAIADAERAAREAPAAGFPTGEWIAPTDWQERGQHTPLATVQTALSAAFGGDVARLERTFHFDEAARAKLAQIFASLPASARGAYVSPERLMAAFTARAIPVGDAQIVWQQQSGPDDAVAFVWVRNPNPAARLETPEKPAPNSKTPPMLPPDPKHSSALLALRRFDDGWRVLVPAQAVDRLAREFARPQ